MRRVLLATGNQGKIREFRALTQDLPIELLTAKEIGLSAEIAENGHTFAENAVKKAAAIAALTNEWTIADDSGIVLPYLGGEPGIYSARYAGEQATDAENNAKLLMKMQSAEGEEREAYFVAEIALVRPGFPPETFHGETRGRLLRSLQGDHGFGYDPLFFVEEYQLTFAQLPMTVKNEISHRGRAMVLLKQRLLQLFHANELN
ncbi:MAG: RdgB/HAM1 family non-canonical purine NTP pyrophosphatase [Negativicutes bacterium]|nr:RdgB/HAM1 family non-canonical purine NTP pyrophosphatase [Negativicutes bacterium]